MARAGGIGRRRHAGGAAAFALAAAVATALATAGPGVAGGGGCAGATTPIGTTASALAAGGETAVCLVNQGRAARGLGPLRPESRLASMAASHNAEMLSRDVFTHTGANGSGPGDRVRALGYPVNSAGIVNENLYWGTGTPSPTSIYNNWLTSTLHTSNMFDSRVNEYGIAVGNGVAAASVDSPGKTATFVMSAQRSGASGPQPSLGRSVVASVVRGIVTYSPPPGSPASALAAQIRGRTFVPLTSAREIPVNSLLNTRRGTIRITTATTSRSQRSEISQGVFQVRQSRRRSSRGLTELRLIGGSYSGCVARGSSAEVYASRRTRRRVRRLRVNARGRFRTRGRAAAGTIRGTIWTTEDRCDGTVIRVRRGVVSVRDFRRRRTINVRAGRSYLARLPG